MLIFHLFQDFYGVLLWQLDQVSNHRPIKGCVFFFALLEVARARACHIRQFLRDMLCDKDKKESCLVLQFPAWHPKLSAFYLVLLLYCILTDLHGFYRWPQISLKIDLMKKRLLTSIGKKCLEREKKVSKSQEFWHGKNISI